MSAEGIAPERSIKRADLHYRCRYHRELVLSGFLCKRASTPAGGVGPLGGQGGRLSISDSDDRYRLLREDNNTAAGRSRTGAPV